MPLLNCLRHAMSFCKFHYRSAVGYIIHKISQKGGNTIFIVYNCAKVCVEREGAGLQTVFVSEFALYLFCICICLFANFIIDLLSDTLYINISEKGEGETQSLLCAIV